MLSNSESIFAFFISSVFLPTNQKKCTNNSINRKSDQNGNAAPLAMSQQTDTKFITRKKNLESEQASEQANECAHKQQL